MSISACLPCRPPLSRLSQLSAIQPTLKTLLLHRTCAITTSTDKSNPAKAHYHQLLTYASLSFPFMRFLASITPFPILS